MPSEGGDTLAGTVGGKIEVRSTQEKGYLLDYDRLSASCKVVLDNTPSKVIKCPSRKLDAVPEVLEPSFTFIHSIDPIQPIQTYYFC